MLSWAGSSNTLSSFTLFFSPKRAILLQDVQALRIWSCFHWQRQKAGETLTVLVLHPFKQGYNLHLFIVMSTEVTAGFST